MAHWSQTRVSQNQLETNLNQLAHFFQQLKIWLVRLILQCDWSYLMLTVLVPYMAKARVFANINAGADKRELLWARELTRSKYCIDSSFVQKFIILRWNYSTTDNNDISKQKQWNNEIDYINMSEWLGRRRREREFFTQPYPLPISFIWAMSSGRSVLWPAAWELIPTTCTSASTACCATSLGVWKQNANAINILGMWERRKCCFMVLTQHVTISSVESTTN